MILFLSEKLPHKVALMRKQLFLPLLSFQLTFLLGPHQQLLSHFRHHQERSPSSLLLGLEDVTEDVIAYVHGVVTLASHQLAEGVARAARVHLTSLERTHVSAYFQGAGFLVE